MLFTACISARGLPNIIANSGIYEAAEVLGSWRSRLFLLCNILMSIEIKHLEISLGVFLTFLRYYPINEAKKSVQISISVQKMTKCNLKRKFSKRLLIYKKTTITRWKIKPLHNRTGCNKFCNKHSDSRAHYWCRGNGKRILNVANININWKKYPLFLIYVNSVGIWTIVYVHLNKRSYTMPYRGTYLKFCKHFPVDLKISFLNF